MKPGFRSVGVVTGLLAEADCLPKGAGNAKPHVYVSAGNALNAFGGAVRLISDGATALLSFGVAGGLDPKLAPGTIVIAEGVLAPDGCRFACDPDWRGRVIAEVRGRFAVAGGVIAGRDGPADTIEAKSALFKSTGAAAVDMESHAVARAAAEAKIPFLAVRAIADPAQRRIPRWALGAIDESGRTRALPVLAKVLVRPWEWPALLTLAGDHRAAMGALSRVARLAAVLAA